jgi:hypothetical protein
MNCCFDRRAVPLAYFAPMGEGQPVKRFDDIWMGIIAKKICDHLGWLVTYGEPFVLHDRASDPVKNFAAEAPGREMNEWLWEFIDRVDLSGATAVDCLCDVADALDRTGGHDYVRNWGSALKIWAELFRE